MGCRVVRYDDISFLAHAIHAAPSVDEFKGKIVFQNDLTPEEDEAFRRVCEDVSTRYPPPQSLTCPFFLDRTICQSVVAAGRRRSPRENKR